ncbi:hypothetical protein ASD11_17530 [Aeromicrobium sp. Root495]|uniref:ArsR/SmtB family transcription factor n=1 Tax=Aeromicrobium sp. Root495 TaxID=1736550 RepID=UPI0006FEA55C|nr:helix-turn-helix domain-containing protein [Aeromicrobium sp. Root495]KQY55344.1 hypothetical protein ASD11_17530 [Aeromicrobium sp. Root495]
MISLRLDEEALRGTTVVVSPFVQTIEALALLGRHGDEAPPPHTRWARRTRSQVGARRWRQLVQVGAHLQDPPIPSSLAPAEAVAATDLDSALAAVGPAAAELELGRGDFIDAVVTLHEVAIAPVWPELRRLLDAEAQRCQQVLAHGHGEELLHTLESRLRWASPVLSIPTAVSIPQGDFVASGLTVGPTAFTRGAHLLTVDDRCGALLTFPARGAGSLPLCSTTPTGGSRPDRLAILIGSGRATVLRTLVEPSTTTELSARLALAPSTVSQHLSSLAEAGVIAKGREGRRVLYQLTADGFELLRRLA